MTREYLSLLYFKSICEYFTSTSAPCEENWGRWWQFSPSVARFGKWKMRCEGCLWNYCLPFQFRDSNEIFFSSELFAFIISMKLTLTLTWHCCGPCRVGDEVFGLCFFMGANETAVVWLEFDEGVMEVAIDVIVEACWAERTIDAFDVDVFCAAAATAAAATVSITLATVKKYKLKIFIHFQKIYYDQRMNGWRRRRRRRKYFFWKSNTVNSK